MNMIIGAVLRKMQIMHTMYQQRMEVRKKLTKCIQSQFWRSYL